MCPIVNDYIEELVQERRNSITLAMELRLSSSNPSMCFWLWPVMQNGLFVYKW